MVVLNQKLVFISSTLLAIQLLHFLQENIKPFLLLSSGRNKVSSRMSDDVRVGKELQQVLAHLLLYDLVSVTEHVQGGNGDTDATLLHGQVDRPVLQSAGNKPSNNDAEPEIFNY